MSKLYIVGICLVLLAGSAGADVFQHIYQSDSVSFVSDGETPNPKTITLDSFDTTDTTGCPPGNWRQLESVTVTVSYDGSVDLLADNDDAFKPGTVKGRIIRTWILDGPGLVNILSSKTVETGEVSLDEDDGDGGDVDTVDGTSPDGTDFGGPVSFAGVAASGSPYTPVPVSLYETAGAGTVDFDITADTIVNDLVWTSAPDTWQLEVENSDLTVSIDLDYAYSCVPEPATMSLLALGGLAVLRRRRK